jgi:hypothetical protein
MMSLKLSNGASLKNNMYLYRGISEELHENNLGLTPKKCGVIFSNAIPLTEPFKLDGNWKIGASIHNAIYIHQRDLPDGPNAERYQRLSRSGVSSSPLLERAFYYATNGFKKNVVGYVYKIDRELLSAHNVVEYDVNPIIPKPKITEDNEIVLVSKTFDALPMSVVVDIFRVKIIIAPQIEADRQDISNWVSEPHA